MFEKVSRKIRTRPGPGKSSVTIAAPIWKSVIIAIALIFTVDGGLAAPKKQLRHFGVNLAGASFAGSRIPGKIDRDYHYPKKKVMDYFLDKGFNTFRLTFKWERLQRNLGWEFEAAELRRMDRTVNYLTAKNAYVLLDPHNYARFFGKLIGSKYVPVSAFASFWSTLANHYKNNSRVIFGLMNEPHGIRADRWRVAAEAAIKAIRATGAKNLILVPGNFWSGAVTWTKNKNGGSNAEAFRTLFDPANNMAFEVHQYFDSNSSGTHRRCVSATIGVERLKPFTRWLRENNRRGFFGEFGAANNPVCLAALDNTLQHIAANSDVWLGWTYWAAGAWWGDYMFSVHPTRDGGDKPQMSVLKKHIRLP
jgi:endoglucanase